jgi:hypothetical protein
MALYKLDEKRMNEIKESLESRRKSSE